VKDRKVLFWDFDGVIKDSVDVKTRAYVDLFTPFGSEIATRVRNHHEQNGGQSRYEKIPLYLGWAGQVVTQDLVALYCLRFSDAVRQAVIDSRWVPGAREYLQENHDRQRFVLVTATPQLEIEDILRALGIAEWFSEVHGAPTPKASAVNSVLSRWGCDCREAILVGDSESDMKAAQSSGVDFLLRKTNLNQSLQRLHKGAQCENFING
jgi:phosphoglycolate phosphatase-like HAD superfamily hydrolase